MPPEPDLSPDLSIVVATFQRSVSLRRTLDGIRSAARAGLSLEIVVVDNADCADTRRVCDEARGEMGDGLSLRYLIAPVAGKNRALNRALNEPGLGRIVAFTDDDTDPDPAWLGEIAATCARWPDDSVFGGRIDVVWPDGVPPGWARDARVQELGFAAHAPLASEAPYPPGRVPFGPNFWVRREVFEAGHRFDERIGPNPDDRILGDETQFLRGLVAAGYRIVFNPAACVGHRVQRQAIEPGVVRRRAYDLGRGIPHERGLPRRELLERSPLMWTVLRRALVLRDRIRVAFTRPLPGVAPALDALRALGFNEESLRLARESHRS